MKIANVLGIITFTYFLILFALDKSDISFSSPSAFLLLIGFLPLAMFMALLGLIAIILGIKYLLSERRFTLGLLLGFLSLIMLYLQYFTVSVVSKSHPATNAEIGSEVEFTGTLTRFNDSCKIDLSCKAYVDGFEITTHPGRVRDPLPLGNSDVWNEDIGKKVSVKAKKIGAKTLTIEGSEDYYVLMVSN